MNAVVLFVTDYDRPLDLLLMAEESDWIDKVNSAHVDDRIATGSRDFHPKNFHAGRWRVSKRVYNLGQKFAFDDATTWSLRFTGTSSISQAYAGEKVAMGLEALYLVWRRHQFTSRKFTPGAFLGKMTPRAVYVDEYYHDIFLRTYFRKVV